ncbi:alanine--tRNA ligase [Malacoplasma penetrans]|uniref:Alanine--tRNA ligase n=1 Tax=Malacoplasma penetrans (strain HF-2) TaxID=272633 RepID=SYA_MALP2|nr:alanine--tRNA ligase [Malacoplasma penetrans]Q8EUR6.1 RecName: Full=Alanine--tRNA ligase; AltName: Full=Alanyl-tRNA synthetase; Short=AlaRS [Malacoplasma penetrans HF-2]RXY97058.1 alanine--tRNA ligase [Malacoplasma penetrans]BAC44646.1 alanyl-tRNA synthetase [Malacoplasma penetrans HF-2]
MSKKLTTNEIRKLWLDFFKSKNHTEVESKSLIPKNDDSLLWINSGVATLKTFFSGKENPPSKRLTNSQRCLRTNDIENVGLTSRHHTFFEMLGNFSIGDYFRKEAIEFGAELVFKVFKLDPKKIYITVYEEDQESFDLWVKNGAIKSHILKCDKSRNFWEIGSGPCGPCTEIYYDRGEKYDFQKLGEKLFFEDIENDRYIEIWNIVFSEFNNDGKNNYTKLARQNIDTGAGLERLACILQDVPTNYDTDAFVNVRSVIEKYSNKKYDNNLYFESKKDSEKVFINKCFSVIIDHFKAVIFAISDGALPSNKDRGYILRKLLRRSFLYLNYLKVSFENSKEIINTIISNNETYYPYLKENLNNVINTIKLEYDLYCESINNSFKKLNELLNKKLLDASDLFNLVTTYGFPIEIVQSLQELLTQSKDAKNLKLAEDIINSINPSDKKISISKLKIEFDEFEKLFDEHRLIANANASVKGMENQNEELLNLPTLDSSFDYEIESVKNSKVLKIFDENWKPVEEIKNKDCWVILDKTCFFATTGGQEHDTGKINKFDVVDVIKSPQGYHLHKVVKGTFKIGEKVDGQINSFDRNIIRKQHSSEHLMHSALKRVVSPTIKQEGAFKSIEKITLDFSFNRKLTYKEILGVEKEVKRIIATKNPTQVLMKTLDEAKEMGAIGYFEQVYKKISGKLRVLYLCPESIEICGGTHVYNTGDIEDFMVTGLTSKGSGSWRIEAVSSNYLVDKFKNNVIKKAIDDFNNYFKKYKELNIKDDEVEKYKKTDINSIHYLELKEINEILKNKINTLVIRKEKENLSKESNEIKNKFTEVKESTKLFLLKDIDRKLLFNSLVLAINEAKSTVFLVINEVDGVIQYVLCSNESFAKNNNLDFNLYAKDLNAKLGGKGGGRSYLVQGTILKIDEKELNKILDTINAKLK